MEFRVLFFFPLVPKSKSYFKFNGEAFVLKNQDKFVYSAPNKQVNVQRWCEMTPRTQLNVSSCSLPNKLCSVAGTRGVKVTFVYCLMP